MKDLRICAECGRELPGNAPEGLCPRCLLQLGAAELGVPADGAGPAASGERPGQPHGGQPPAAREDARPTVPQTTKDPPSALSASPPATKFGDYELLEKIGQGGMGVVYRARQVSLDRIVALKMLPFGPFTRDDVIERFRAEASAAARLQHPHIVAIHEVGECDGQPYFSMDYIAGQTLADVVRDQPLPARQAARYLKRIAEAVHHAHQHGILHRDLKPSNVLIDQLDEPRVTDFGLAKRLGIDSDLTLTGQVLGSPSFMSPEQAEGRSKDVGPASDVYSLGGLLYHVLTRQPPFQADTLTTLLKQVVETEPLPPRLLNPGVPRDLETICLKCLEKDITRRYPTAQALADELGRFLDGEPIQARPIGAVGKAWKWCQRRPALAGTLAALVVTFGLGLSGALWLWARAENQRHRAELESYAADMRNVQWAIGDGNLSLATSLLNKHRPSAKGGVDLRHWEWRYLWQLSKGDPSVVLHQSSTRSWWRAFSPDRRLLALRENRHVTLWDLPHRKPLPELPVADDGILAFSSGGNLLAISRDPEGGPPVVEIWDTIRQKPVKSVAHAGLILSLAFSPDDRLLALFENEGKSNNCAILVTDWAAGQVLARFSARPVRRGGTGVAFSPDGQQLAIGADYGGLQLVDWPNRSTVTLPTGTSDGVSTLAFSPDGTLLAVGFFYEMSTIQLWDTRSATLRGQLTNHLDYVTAVAFSADGQSLASASGDQTIRLWRVADLTELRCLRGSRGEVRGVAFLPDGRSLVSIAADNAVRLWDIGNQVQHPGHFELAISAGQKAKTEIGAPNFSARALDPAVVDRLGFTFTPDSRSFITTDPAGSLALWDTRTLAREEPLPWLGTNCWGVAISPSGKWLAVGEASGQLNVWDWPARRLVAKLSLTIEWFGRTHFSRSDRFLLATAFRNDRTPDFKIWRTGDWAEVPLNGIEKGLASADLSPNDRWLAIEYWNALVKVWEFPSLRHQAVLPPHTEGGTVGFSPAGRTLASASTDGLVVLWDVSTQRKLAELRGQAASWSPVFSPDGRRLATGGSTPKDAVKLWDIATQREILSLPADGHFFLNVLFSPDGNTLVAAPLSGKAQIWHAPSWAEIEAREKGEMRP